MKTFIDLKRTLANTFLGLVLMQSNILLAQSQPTQGTFKLQMTLYQRLGEQPAERYREIIPPNEQISWQV